MPDDDEPRIPIEIEFDKLMPQFTGRAMIEAARAERARRAGLYRLFGLKPPPDEWTTNGK